MGGCPIGTDAKTSVVSPDFQVHGFPNLYAADSSIFPTAPGINPSYTIMALSVRASRKMLNH
jgi:choline dehydrogenase-like flavoprotein